MFERLVSKAYASTDVLATSTVSGGLLSSPLWLDALTGWLQMVTLVIGILVGISAYRLNTARRKELEDTHG